MPQLVEYLLAKATAFIKSSAADSATAVALVVDTSAAWVNATAKLLSIRNNAVEKVAVLQTGAINTAYLTLGPNGFSDPGIGSATTPSSRIGFGTNVYVNANGGAFIPEADLTTINGSSARRWTESWACRYAHVEKVVTFSATPAFTAADGEHQQITMTANITSWTLAAGLVGEIVTIEFIQDATGTRTLAGTPANVRLAGGALVLTITASKRDTLTLRYNTASTAWVEVARSQNI